MGDDAAESREELRKRDRLLKAIDPLTPIERLRLAATLIEDVRGMCDLDARHRRYLNDAQRALTSLRGARPEAKTTPTG